MNLSDMAFGGFSVTDAAGNIVSTGDFGMPALTPGTGPFPISGSTIGAKPTSVLGFPVPPTAGTPPASATKIPDITATPGMSGVTAGSLADYFARAIIIILGFIFVAIGLNMLRPGTVPMPTKIT
jgi:hypothetical protein